MKIAFDISPLLSGHKGRGVGTYTCSLQAALKDATTKHTFSFTPNPDEIDADITHYPYFDLFQHTLPLRKKNRTVVTIHDLIPLKYPEKFPAGIKGTLKLKLQKLSLKTVDVVITDSEASKTDIIDFLGISSQKIHTIYLAADEGYKPQSKKSVDSFKKKFKLIKPFVGYVGDINYNKNIPRLISVFSKIKEYQLVIVTRADLTQDIPEAKSIVVALEKAKNVRILQLPKKEQLNLFYASCDWYIQPSLAEGFGLPVLEAMQSGTPVLVAKATSLPEIAGDAGVYFNPKSSNSMITKVKSVAKYSKNRRQSIIEKSVKRAKMFSWKKTAKETIEVYKSVLT